MSRKRPTCHLLCFKDFGQCLMQLNHRRKELLVVVFALEKFLFYLLRTKDIIYFNHAAFKFLLKKEAKSRFICWILLLQEFDVGTQDKKDSKNLVADLLSCPLSIEEPLLISDEFPNEYLFYLKQISPWYADIVNYLAIGRLLEELSRHEKDKIKSDSKFYVLMSSICENSI